MRAVRIPRTTSVGVAARCRPRSGSNRDTGVAILDPGTVTDQATYAASSPTGIAHVLVAGTFVVRNGTTWSVPSPASKAAPR
jgi:hypothetical protein